jgi:hypothetical protein
VAHLDSELTARIPLLEIARKSAAFLYDHLLLHEDEGQFFSDGPRSSLSFYSEAVRLAESVYERQR